MTEHHALDPPRTLEKALSDMAEARERDPHIAFRRDAQTNHWCRKPVDHRGIADKGAW